MVRVYPEGRARLVPQDCELTARRLPHASGRWPADRPCGS